MLDMVLQFLDEGISGLCLVFIGKHHGGLDNHSAYFVRNACHGTFHNSRVGHQGTFHFKRPDAVAARLDNVIGSAHKPVVAVFVTPCQVASVVVAIVPCLMRLFGVAVVAFEQS